MQQVQSKSAPIFQEGNTRFYPVVVDEERGLQPSSVDPENTVVAVLRQPVDLLTSNQNSLVPGFEMPERQLPARTAYVAFPKENQAGEALTIDHIKSGLAANPNAAIKNTYSLEPILTEGQKARLSGLPKQQAQQELAEIANRQMAKTYAEGKERTAENLVPALYNGVPYYAKSEFVLDASELDNLTIDLRSEATSATASQDVFAGATNE